MDCEVKIHGGFYLKARKTQQSWIAHAPPHVRIIWDWLLMSANWKDGDRLKRGQLLTSYKEIQEGTHWMVGWRKQKYSKNDCETTMNLLKKHTMVHTEKTTRGMVVTICNFDKYQNPKNYEPYSDNHKKHTRNIQTADTISKEGEEREESKENHLALFDAFWSAYPKKKAKEHAVRAWNKINPNNDLAKIIIQAVLDNKKHNNQWLKDDGQFIPHPATWLNGKMWDDALDVEPTKTQRTTGSGLLDAYYEQEGLLDAQ